MNKLINKTNKFDIVYFGNDWFAENKTSSHHIAEQLSKLNRIIYVESPGLRAPKGTGRDIKKLFSKIWKSLRGPRKINDNFYVYTLFQLPFHHISFVRSTNKLLILISIKLLLFWLRVKSPLLWFVVPHLYMVPGHFNSKGSVYYCIDDYASLPDVDIDSVSFMDKEMTIRCDMVFVASQTLLTAKKLLNPNVFASPHGVDFELFNQVYTGKIKKLPADMKHIKSPIIGFWGLIEEWIDLELIRFLAKRHIDWNFVMIGRVAVQDNPCFSLSNVHFIGRKEFKQLPGYANGFDVGILPYKLNQQVMNCNPIKLREYLATGMPVVSVKFPQVLYYEDVVYIAENDLEFEQYLELALQDNSVEASARRVDSVKGDSWETKVQQVFNKVLDTLESGK